MAKSNGFFGLRRGSTKSLTFQVNNGVQITKDRVTNVKNPRSSLQMRQRALMGTIGRAYSCLKEICDHSYEGVSYGFGSMNEFRKLNYKNLPSWLERGEGRISSYDGDAVVNPYIISSGSIDPWNILVNAEGPVATEFDLNLKTEKQLQDLTIADILYGYDETQKGMIYTFVFMVESMGGGSMMKYLRVNTGADDITKRVSELMSFDNNFVGDEKLTVSVGNAKDIFLDINYGYGEGSGHLVGGAVIKSKLVDGVWKRSNASFAIHAVPNYNSAINSYPVGADYLLNGENV